LRVTLSNDFAENGEESPVRAINPPPKRSTGWPRRPARWASRRETTLPMSVNHGWAWHSRVSALLCVQLSERVHRWPPGSSA